MHYKTNTIAVKPRLCLDSIQTWNVEMENTKATWFGAEIKLFFSDQNCDYDFIFD